MAPESPFFNVTEHVPELSALQKTIWSYHYDAAGHPYPAVQVTESPFLWAMTAWLVVLGLIIAAYEFRHKVPMVRVRWARQQRALYDPEFEMGSDTDTECGGKRNV